MKKIPKFCAFGLFIGLVNFPFSSSFASGEPAQENNTSLCHSSWRDYYNIAVDLTESDEIGNFTFVGKSGENERCFGSDENIGRYDDIVKAVL